MRDDWEKRFRSLQSSLNVTSRNETKLELITRTVTQTCPPGYWCTAVSPTVRLEPQTSGPLAISLTIRTHYGQSARAHRGSNDRLATRLLLV